VAAAATEITCPALIARELLTDMALFEPDLATRQVHTLATDPQARVLVADEPMASCQVTLGRDAEVAHSCAAGIRAMRSPLQFLQRVHHVQEWIALAAQLVLLVSESAVDHLREHVLQLWGVHLIVAVRCVQQRRKADAVEAFGDEVVQHAPQATVERRDRHSGGHLHAPLSLKQRLKPDA